MEGIFLVMVIILAALAVSDLVVGVSNDAVNFLNSAIGSKVASRVVIMSVASLGIIIGATFSSGMMEVARSGIFNPEALSFQEVMVIFTAVMLTDIILLDLFNTFGMPTSTTVSIVFELLGASVAVSMIKLTAAGDGFGQLPEYINSSKALAIISGIFLSVAIAFVVGLIIQFFSRLLFTFDYWKRLQRFGPLWAGAALVALTYFLLIKGLKGASFVSAEFLEWVKTHTMTILVGSYAVWVIVLYALVRFMETNILRVVVLAGTFSLAMAFAGNDLVNFIGVPVAGLESFQLWKASGMEASAYDMQALGEPVRTNTLLLLLAGIIMVTTLWFSAKARSVTETEVNLARQDDGAERFQPNILARGLVRTGQTLGRLLFGWMPRGLKLRMARKFMPKEKDQGPDKPAFDLLRASVNLSVAAMLISLATSYKLPLSTTYVSFMVAMGTSLADRAWGSDSAVYRVSGVLSVIGGWLLTAVIAFTVSSIFATLINTFGIWAIGFLLLTAVGLIARTFVLHRQNEARKTRQHRLARAVALPLKEFNLKVRQSISEEMGVMRKVWSNAISGLVTNDSQVARQGARELKVVNEQYDNLSRSIFGELRQHPEATEDRGRALLELLKLQQDILQSLTLIQRKILAHLDNMHATLKPRQKSEIKRVGDAYEKYLKLLSEIISNGTSDFSELDAMQSNVVELVDRLLEDQLVGNLAGTYSTRNGMLVTTIVNEGRDLIQTSQQLLRLMEVMDENGDGKFSSDKPKVISQE